MQHRNVLATSIAVLGLAFVGCGGDDGARTADTTAAAGAASPSEAISPGGQVIDDIAIAPEDFVDPTRISNELYPVSEVPYLIMLGDDEGRPLRVEVTLLPGTKTIEWDGGSTETIVSQFLAVTDGELVEVANDWFAQDDSGNVWYFGEDVFNYDNGEVVNTDGTWIAGHDRPPGMIMPAAPRVGDVYHPENIPGLVFEEDVVVSIDETVDGPSGKITGVLSVEEHLMEGDVEKKLWAPGYGEFRAIHPGVEDVMVVFALPNDAQDEPVPSSLADLRSAAHDAFELARTGDWDVLAGSIGDMQAHWADYDPSSRPVLPEEFTAVLDEALSDLVGAVNAHDSDAAAVASIGVELAALDVVMTHGTLPDAQRIDALGNQAALAEATGDNVGLANAQAMIEAIEARS